LDGNLVRANTSASALGSAPAMTDTPHTDASASGASGGPTTAEALAGLDMPLPDAMMTQRAIRRVRQDPVDDVGRLPVPTGRTGSSTSSMTRRVMEKLGNRTFSSGTSTTTPRFGVSPTASRRPNTARAVACRADHFTEIPVLVACPRLGVRDGRASLRAHAYAIELPYHGSISPTVQNLLPARRAMGLRASLITLPPCEWGRRTEPRAAWWALGCRVDITGRRPANPSRRC
jgi:hypothetical protein